MAKKAPEVVPEPVVLEVVPEPAWQPPAGERIFPGERSYIVWDGKDRWEHVSEAPNGDWVYRRS